MCGSTICLPAPYLLLRQILKTGLSLRTRRSSIGFLIILRWDCDGGMIGIMGCWMASAENFPVSALQHFNRSANHFFIFFHFDCWQPEFEFSCIIQYFQ